MFAKSILITGSNRGIGLELVKLLAGQSEHVFAGCRSPAGAKELNSFGEHNKNVVVLELDVTKQATIDAAREIVQKIVGDQGLNCIINNAAIANWEEKCVEKVTADGLRSAYEVNTIGPTMIIKTFLPLLKQAASQTEGDIMSTSRAAILNMSSQIGSIADNSSGTAYSYRMAKVAMNMLTKNLSIELKPDHILAVNLHPGWVQTALGGQNAIITAALSAEKLVNMAAKFTGDDNGKFFSWKGTEIPW